MDEWDKRAKKPRSGASARSQRTQTNPDAAASDAHNSADYVLFSTVTADLGITDGDAKVRVEMVESLTQDLERAS